MRSDSEKAGKVVAFFCFFVILFLILSKLAAKNIRSHINKFAKVLPMKAQKIRPYIIGFVEFK